MCKAMARQSGEGSNFETSKSLARLSYVLNHLEELT
jgi:hypothetical protein